MLCIPNELDQSTAVVAEWLSAMNAGTAERLVALADPGITIIGPRGRARGAGELRAWLARASAHLATTAVFARDDRVVVAQLAVWRAPETGAFLGAADVASRFVVVAGLVVEYQWHDALADALECAGLTIDDWT